jgi:hypothetical protein
MSKKSINPLNIHKVRRAVFCPPYFESMTLSLGYRHSGSTAMHNWIHTNMSGRYFIGDVITVDDNSTVITLRHVAFENPSELSLFMLSCPYLK